MTPFQRIELKDQVPSQSGIQFLYAEVAAASTGPLAIVHYADEGNEQPLGLRLDMDKKVFIDRLDDREKDDAVSSGASIVASVIFGAVRGRA